MNPLRESFESTRPSPGPGFESRAVASAMTRARKRRRRRRAIAAATGAGAGVTAVILAVVAAGRGPVAVALDSPVRAQQAEAEPAVTEAERQVAGGLVPDADDYSDLEIPAGKRPAVEAIALELKKREIKLTAEIDVVELELAALLARRRPDRAAVKRQVRERSRLLGELELARVMAWLELRAALGKRPPRPPRPPKPAPEPPEVPDRGHVLNPFDDKP